MDLLWMIVGGVSGVGGVILIAAFIVMRYSGDILEMEVTGFQKDKNKGRALPIVRYEDDEGNVTLVEVRVIEQIAYLLGPPIEKQSISISGATGKTPRVFGYFKLVCGVVLLAISIAALGVDLEKALLVGQASYILIFIGLMVSGWALLKFIQRH